MYCMYCTAHDTLYLTLLIMAPSFHVVGGVAGVN